jgi:hypothetical protein
LSHDPSPNEVFHDVIGVPDDVVVSLNSTVIGLTPVVGVAENETIGMVIGVI